MPKLSHPLGLMVRMILTVVIPLVAGAVAAAVAAFVTARLVRRGAGSSPHPVPPHGQPQPDGAMQQAAALAELRRVSELVGQLQQQQAHAHGELAARLGDAVRSTRELGLTTRQLQEALGNSRVRGQWGERMAADVLQAAGLVEGINFRCQQTIDGGTRPDITVLLPEERFLHVDVKFPIDQYLASLDAPSDRERAEHEQAFLRAVRGHLKAVAGRGYADPATTPGFAVVFIPNEAVYAFVMAVDGQLVDTALTHGVLLCSPFTLFAVLAVVRQASEAFRLGQASEEILGSLGRFRVQWQKFAEQLDRVERQFETAHRGFEELVGPRRRQLERHLDRVEQVGAPDAKPLLREVGVGR